MEISYKCRFSFWLNVLSRNAYRFWWQNLKKKDNLENRDIDGRNINLYLK